MAERLAADVARLPFAQVRFNYFVNWYAKSTTLAKGWSEVPADWALGDSPNPSHILDNLTSLLKVKPSGKADFTGDPDGDVKIEAFTERLRVAIETTAHPYDKVGAILSIFKEYRAELARVGKVTLYTEHIKLRTFMTHLLEEFSRQALRHTQDAILPRGFGETLAAAYKHDAVAEYLTQKPGPERGSPSLDLLFHDEERVYVEKWADEKDQYMLRSTALGKALRQVPPGLMYLFCGDGIRRFTSMATTPRKPDFWFVLKHYMATHSSDTWSRPFVVDTLLRHGKTIYGNEGVHQAEDAEEDRCSARTYPSQLAPTMKDDDFTQQWRDAERAAWRDYRHLRLVLIEDDPSSQVPKLAPPANTDLVKLLRKSPAAVFDDYFPPTMLPLAPRLLSAAIPGLGMHYQAVVDLDNGVQLGTETMRAILTNSASDILALQDNETTELPNDLFV